MPYFPFDGVVAVFFCFVVIATYCFFSLFKFTQFASFFLFFLLSFACEWQAINANTLRTMELKCTCVILNGCVPIVSINSQWICTFGTNLPENTNEQTLFFRSKKLNELKKKLISMCVLANKMSWTFTEHTSWCDMALTHFHSPLALWDWNEKKIVKPCGHHLKPPIRLWFAI